VIPGTFGSFHVNPGKVLYVYRNVQTRSCEHCCSGKAISIAYSQCVSVALVNQDAYIFPYYLINGTILEKKKTKNIRFHENPSSEGRVFPCWQTDRQTDMTTLIVAFRNSTNAPKKILVARSKLISATFRQAFSCYLYFRG